MTWSNNANVVLVEVSVTSDGKMQNVTRIPSMLALSVQGYPAGVKVDILPECDIAAGKVVDV